MSLVIRNLQKFVSLNETALYEHSIFIRQIAGFNDFDLGIMLLCDSEIAKINKKYRGYNEPTDVLAFPFHEISPENAEQLPNVDAEEKMLGDILLGMPYIEKQAIKNGTEVMCDVITHITHGVCHLIGYDHNTPSTWLAMYNKELHILEKFNKQTGYSCVPLLKVGHYLDT